MPTEIVMPRLSDTMDRGTVARWNKQVGDTLKRGDVLLEIETDKANMELESYADGILARVMVNEGETAEVGAPIGIVAADEAELKAIQSETAPEAPSLASSTPVHPESPAPATATDVPSDETAAPPSVTASNGSGRIKASPLAKRIAREQGIDLAKVNGTGPGGRIVRDDVESFGAEQSDHPAEAPRLSTTLSGADEEIELSRMQMTVGKRLAESAFTAPHFFVTSEIDMTKALALRAEINKGDTDFKVSVNDLIVKAVARTLVKVPQVNASYRDGKIVRHGSVNVGIAVDLPDGLIVPVLQGVDGKSLREIATESKDIIARARDSRLKRENLSGGTFTVSNLGMFGVDQFTAIINPPESAILAVGAIIEKPVVVDGAIVIRSRMRVTLSSDHRVIYGADAATFLSELRSVLERPIVGLLDL